MLDRFSFVELKAAEAEKAVEFLDGTKLKGKQIRMEVARSYASCPGWRRCGARPGAARADRRALQRRDRQRLRRSLLRP